MANSPSNIRFLLGYYRPYAARTLAAVLIGLPVSAISLAFPALTGRLVDSMLGADAPEQLTSVGLIFLVLLVVQATIGYVVSVTLARTTERVIAALRSDLFRHLVYLPMAYLSQRRVGELSSRLSSDITSIQETFSFSILQLLRQSVFLVGSLVVIISTSLPLTIPIIIGMPIIVAIALVIGRRIRKLSTATQDALAGTATIVEETLQSMAAVKSYVQERHEVDRYSASLAQTVQLAIRGARLRAAFVTFILTVIFGGIAAVILYGAQLVAAGDVTIGELLSFLMYAMFVGGALGSVAEVLGQIQKSLGATVRIREILDVPLEPPDHDQASTERYTTVAFHNVGFAYPERTDVPVLHDLTFSIAAGERVALVGQSGSGKSTTAALIQRLYEPTSGRILYDGRSAEDLALSTVRQSVGVVPQDIVLFGGTIEENIRYGRRDADVQEVLDAARRANALSFIESFPEGMNTLVGERGMKLSGGQRQRIAIARALLKDPPILILDEATSSLDAESEQLIQEALEHLLHRRTSIIIAHRLSTVRTCDRILVMDGGRIVEHGTHNELLDVQGRYARWCDLQFMG